MSRPAVSVVLPCWNAAGSLLTAIDSIRAQTFPDWELLVFDDGSTDESASLAHARAQEDARIRVMPSPHAGIVVALQQACSEARGQYIARMDADDLAHPNRLARQLHLMQESPNIALCGTQVRMVGGAVGYGRCRYRDWINALISHEEIVRDLFVECPIPHPTFLMRRDAFDLVGGYQDRDWAEDYDLCMRMFLAGMRFGKVAEPLLDWTESPGRLSMISPQYTAERFRALKREYLFRTYLKGRDVFYQWGAGEVGKRWLREWTDPRPCAVVDINPRKIGRTMHRVPVIAPETLPPPGAAFTVIAVGAPTARDEIRQWLTPRGYRELDDYLFLA